MSIATSAIERLQDVAGRTGAVTRADQRATAAELHVPLAAVHGAATFYDDLAKTPRGSRHVRVCEGTACFAADGGQHAAAGPVPRYVVNGDEGDPGSFCDRVLMEQDPHRVLAGLAYAAHAVGAERGYVYVRSEYPAALERLNVAAAEATAAGHLGRNLHGTATRFEVEIVEGAGSYVAGEETALIHALEGRRGAVRPRPPYPTSSGLFGAPTAVNNVETLAAVPWIVARGGEAFASFGRALETGTKLACLNEAFAAPGVYEVELGMPIREILDELGGGLRDDRRLRSVQVGGPLGGFLAPDELNVPLLESALAAYGVALGHASLIAIDDRVSAAALLRHVWRFAAVESCGTCTPCRIGSGRGAALAERLAAGAAAALAEQQPLLATLETASMCAFGRGVPASVRNLLRVYADELAT
jgi:NADH:ubiquinone oxidoreductase subunit F (NADH-binding)